MYICNLKYVIGWGWMINDYVIILVISRNYDVILNYFFDIFSWDW